MDRSQVVDRVTTVLANAHGGAYSRAAAVVAELERMGLVAFSDSPDRRGRVRRGPGPGQRGAMISAIEEGIEREVRRRKGV